MSTYKGVPVTSPGIVQEEPNEVFGPDIEDLGHPGHDDEEGAILVGLIPIFLQ